MLQFRRDTRVTIGLDTTQFVINGSDVQHEQLRIRFVVVKNQLSAQIPNSMQITIYNLSAATREKLSKFGTAVSLDVGYGNELRTLFVGIIQHAIHTHEDTEWLSTLYCWDLNGIQANESVISLSLADGTTVRQAIDKVALAFGPAAEGFEVLDLDRLDQTKLLRPMEFTGPTGDALTILAESYDFQWSFQDGRLEIKSSGAVFPGGAVRISVASGMIGSPVVTDLGIEVNTLLNPAIRVWRHIIIESVGADVKIGQIETRSLIPTLHQGTYTVGEVTFTGDTWGNEWMSRVKTFRASSGQP